MRRRTTTWLLPTLVVVAFLLNRFGWVSGPAAATLVIAAEPLLLARVAGHLLRAARRYRRDRVAGLDAWLAVEEGLATLLPRRLARLVAIEPQMWACVAMLVRRRRLATDEFAYHRRSPMGALLVVVLLTAPVELLLFELFVPWSWLRWVLIVGAVYGLVWMVGLYASLRVLPHRLAAAEVRCRSGLLGEAIVPYAAIGSATVEARHPVGGGEGIVVHRDTGAVSLAIGGRTDVTLALTEPIVVRRMVSPTPPVSTIHVAVDDPGRFADAIRARAGLAEAPSPAEARPAARPVRPPFPATP